MLWVCRAGQNSVYYDAILSSHKIYLPWEGYEYSLGHLNSMKEFRDAVTKEKGNISVNSISNWASQIYSFCVAMQPGDLVLVPSFHSRSYALLEIIGPYQFNKTVDRTPCHSRAIKVLYTDIPSHIFSQTVRYSLGTFRTVFRIKQELEIYEQIQEWQNTLIGLGG